MTESISAQTARHYVMGRQGLWPGRRWRGLEGTAAAMRAMEDLQLDPLVVVARAHDLMLHSRVIDYAIDDWAILTYERREFFDWGGWLAVRPMDELPYFRVLMRREATMHDGVRRLGREHAEAIEEMRIALRERGELSNRDFAMHTRTRVTREQSYRGRKDSAVALYYLWRVGEAMVTRRDRFERVYALTEAVAPAKYLREATDVEADEWMVRKTVAANGLTKMTALAKPRASTTEKSAWREAWLETGEFVEVQVEGWKAIQIALGSDVDVLRELEAGSVPAAWAPLATTTEEEATFLSPLDPVSARGRAKPLFGFDYVWEVYKPVEKRQFGYYTLPILWGDRLVGRFDPKLDRSTNTLVIQGFWLEDDALARDVAFHDALAHGMQRFVRFLGAARIDATAVAQAPIRKRLRAVKPPK